MDANSTPETLMHQIEQHLELLGQLADARAASTAQELARCLLEVHRVGLSRMLELVAQSPHHEAITTAWTADPLVSNLLALHDLHPLDPATRVRMVVQQMRAAFDAHGLVVLGADLANGEVCLRLLGNLPPSVETLDTLKRQVQEAMAALVPEVAAVVIEEQREPPRVSLPLIPS